MAVKREGLPFKPGQKLPMEAAAALDTAVPVEKLKPATAEQIKTDEKKQLQAAITNIESVAIEKPEVVLTEDNKQALRVQGLSKLSQDERTALGLIDDVRRCNRCGHDLSKKVTEDPTPEDKQTFLRALYTEDRFMKQYSLFNGMVKVWFRARDTRESDDVIKQLHKDVEIHRNDPSLIHVRITRLNLVCGLARIEWYDENGDPVDVKDFPEVNKKNYVSTDDNTISCIQLADEQVLQPLNESLFNAIFHVFMKFTVLVEMMMSRAEDSDFWQATK